MVLWVVAGLALLLAVVALASVRASVPEGRCAEPVLLGAALRLHAAAVPGGRLDPDGDRGGRRRSSGRRRQAEPSVSFVPLSAIKKKDPDA